MTLRLFVLTAAFAAASAANAAASDFATKSQFGLTAANSKISAPGKGSARKLPAVQKAGSNAYVPPKLKRPLAVNPGLNRGKGQLIAPMFRPAQNSK